MMGGFGNFIGREIRDAQNVGFHYFVLHLPLDHASLFESEDPGRGPYLAVVHDKRARLGWRTETRRMFMGYTVAMAEGELSYIMAKKNSGRRKYVLRYPEDASQSTATPLKPS